MEIKLLRVGLCINNKFTEFALCTNPKTAAKEISILDKLCQNRPDKGTFKIIEYPLFLDTIDISDIHIELSSDNAFHSEILSQKKCIEKILEKKSTDKLAKYYKKKLDECNRLLCDIFVRDYASTICDQFEELLEKHHIRIPDLDRTGNEDEANIYGTTYAELEDSISEILITLVNNVKFNPFAAINADKYSGQSYYVEDKNMYEINRLREILKKAIEHIINCEDDLVLDVLKSIGLNATEIEEIRKEYL